MKVIFLDIDGVICTTGNDIYLNRQYKQGYWLNFKYNDMFYIIYNFFKKIIGLKRGDYLTYFYYKYFTDIFKLDPICCSNLQYILDHEPDVRIVVSSVWRSWGTKCLKKILKINGIDPNKVIDITTLKRIERDGHVLRGYQIEEWLNEHIVEKYLIIDDDSDMTGNQLNNFVQTNSFNGLTFVDVEKCLKILKTEVKQ